MNKLMLLFTLVACKTDKTEGQPALAHTASTSTRSASIPATRYNQKSVIVPAMFLSSPQTFMKEETPAIYPGSISVETTADKYEGFLMWSSEFISGPAHEVHVQCKLDFLERGGKITERIDWNTAFHIVGNGKRLEVADITVNEWPEGFDDEVKQCILGLYTHRGVDSDVVADVTFDYPLCFVPVTP